MERIKLGKTEKRVTWLFNSYGSDALDTIARSHTRRALSSLEEKGLVRVVWLEGGDFEAAQLTLNGEAYLIENPNLSNPIDWCMVALIINIFTLVFTICNLVIICNKF